MRSASELSDRIVIITGKLANSLGEINPRLRKFHIEEALLLIHECAAFLYHLSDRISFPDEVLNTSEPQVRSLFLSTLRDSLVSRLSEVAVDLGLSEEQIPDLVAHASDHLMKRNTFYGQFALGQETQPGRPSVVGVFSQIVATALNVQDYDTKKKIKALSVSAMVELDVPGFYED